MTLSQIERRLTTLERTIAAISARDAAVETPDMNAWIDEIHGTFKDDASYRKAARLGERWRKAQRRSASRGRKSEAE
jgi:hypothetical protein